MRKRIIRASILIFIIVGLSLASILVREVHLSALGMRLDRAGTGPFGLRLGLDLQGGSHLVYRVREENPTPDQVERAVHTIERRVNAFGVAEPIVQALGSDRVLVQLPGIRDVEEAKRLIGQTAKLEFKERTCTNVDCSQFEDVPIGLTGDNLARAFPGQDPVTGSPIINIQFDSQGASTFAELTRRIAGDPNKRIAIFLDNQELIAPTVEEPILNGQGIIRGPDSGPGRFTTERVRTLSIQLESGALPVDLELIQESDVDAVLGTDSLNRSFQAGIVGLALVLFFMVAYYRVPGLVAGIALAIYAAITLAIFKMMPVTLTLSGIAGFILSIGMAVDANVLIFERMKEEIRLGRTLSSAMERGFDRAWTAIRDSNVSTFITTAILYWFGSRTGTSLVQGFAVTLFIGVAVSMFTAITVSRNLLQIVALTPIAKRLALFSPEGVRRLAEVAPARGPEPAEGRRA